MRFHNISFMANLIVTLELCIHPYSFHQNAYNFNFIVIFSHTSIEIYYTCKRKCLWRIISCLTIRQTTWFHSLLYSRYLNNITAERRLPRHCHHHYTAVDRQNSVISSTNSRRPSDFHFLIPVDFIRWNVYACKLRAPKVCKLSKQNFYLTVP